MLYPIGIQTFEQIREEGFVYVDKTDLVYKLATSGKIYFLSRPRRFGKSLLLSTLANYFLGHREVFRGLAIDGIEKDWMEYPVFRIDFNGGNFTKASTLEEMVGGYVRSWEREWGRDMEQTDYGTRLAYVFHQAHVKTGKRVVVLVDEYDKPLLDVLDIDRYTDMDGNRVTLEEKNRETLKGLYSVFKKADADLRFVFLTGVTKFSQVSVFSGFNQPQDISLDPTYATLCGITDEEMEHYFSEPIAMLADTAGMSYEAMRAKLRHQYDGYHFSERAPGVYNPFSVLNCLCQQTIRDYWFASGTPSYLVRLLDGFDADINEIIATSYEAADFMDSKAVKAQPLPMIYQSGYLTIKDYDEETNSYQLDFPNYEVRKGFVKVLAANYFAQRSEQTSWIINVARALKSGDTAKFQKHVTALLAKVTYRFQHKKDEAECERYFHLSFYLILQMIGIYNVYAERETSEGRIDCVVEAGDYVYIMEIKLDGSADEAMRQIDERGYAKPYADDKRHIVKLAINFSSQTGNIAEMKEERI